MKPIPRSLMNNQIGELGMFSYQNGSGGATVKVIADALTPPKTLSEIRLSFDLCEKVMISASSAQEHVGIQLS